MANVGIRDTPDGTWELYEPASSSEDGEEHHCAFVKKVEAYQLHGGTRLFLSLDEARCWMEDKLDQVRG